MLQQHDPALTKYLEGLAPSTARNRRWQIQKFFDYCKVEPEEAVEWQRRHAGDYRFVDLAYEWFKSQSWLRVSSIQTKYGCIRGFFLANRVPLPKDSRHRFHSDKAPVFGELTVDEFRQILYASNPSYRCAYAVMFWSGSGVGELLHINTALADHVFDMVKRGKKFVRLVMPGRKANRNRRPYFTFIGGDVIGLLRRLFASRAWKRDTVLFRTDYGKPVTSNSLQTYFRSRAFKLGLVERKTINCWKCGKAVVWQRRKVEGKNKIYYVCAECGLDVAASDCSLNRCQRAGVRYRMRTHELRDLFKTEWHRGCASTGADLVCSDFFMGHDVDPLKYDKLMRDTSFALEQYRKVLPWLNILSEDPRKIERSEVLTQLEASETKVDALARELGELRRRMKVLDHPKLIEILDRLEAEE